MMNENNVEQDNNLNKLNELEKRERLSNNKLKCLEITIKILSGHLEKNKYENVITQIKHLSLKKQQSGFVILGMIKYSLKMLFPKIQNHGEMRYKYLECLKKIFQMIEIHDDPNFNSFRSNLMKALETGNWNEIQHLVFNFNYGPENKIEVLNSPKKKIKLEETAGFNTESSTKIDNKLDISINKESLATTRNLNIVSPVSQTSMRINSALNIRVLNKDLLKFSKVDYKIKLPFLSMAVDITMSAVDIKKLFINEMKSFNMKIRGDENSEEIFAEKKERKLIKSILECLRISKRNDECNSINLTIKYSDNKYERIIELNSNSGIKESCETLMLHFVRSLIKKVKKMRVVRKSDGLDLENVIREHKNMDRMNEINQYGPSSPFSYHHLNEHDQSFVDHSNKEASNYYEFYKILSQDNYDLGKSVSDFVRDFKLKYRNNQRFTAQPMEELAKFTDDCVSTFHCYFNFGKSNTERMLPYCRNAVEKFLFNKVYYLLYEIYDKKSQEENKKFLINQNNIKVKLNVGEIMEYLEIKKKFRGDVTDSTSQHFLPYKSTIDCINKVEFEQTPKEKFECLMKASLDLRNGILDATKGKSELNSMDDELPLFIYLITQINVKNIVLELSIIEDYLKFSKSIDKESKVLTNIKSSVFYISNDWILE